MRSKRSCARVDGALLVLSLAFARAEEKPVVRVRISVAELPRQDDEVKLADPAVAALPDGAKNGGKIPAAWPHGRDDYLDESSHCTADRRAAIDTIRGDEVTTQTIFTAPDGKTYLDSAYLKLHGGTIAVDSAYRLPLARVADGLWAMRKKDAVVLVSAVDEGVFNRAEFYGCVIRQTTVSAPAGTFSIVSSGIAAERVRKEMGAKRPKWVGLERVVRGSVSRSSADPAPMLNVVITTPSPDSP